jgi:hypothetical protein
MSADIKEKPTPMWSARAKRWFSVTFLSEVAIAPIGEAISRDKIKLLRKRDENVPN